MNYKEELQKAKDQISAAMAKLHEIEVGAVAQIMAQDAQNLHHGPTPDLTLEGLKKTASKSFLYPIGYNLQEVQEFERRENVCKNAPPVHSDLPTCDPLPFKKRLPTIAGYKGRDLGDMFRWGCSYIEKEFLERIHSYGITSLTLDVDGEPVTVSKEQMNQIFEYLNLQE